MRSVSSPLKRTLSGTLMLNSSDNRGMLPSPHLIRKLVNPVVSSPRSCTLMLMSSRNSWTCFQRKLDFKQESTIWPRLPFLTTGSPCLQSAASTTVIPPNGRSTFLTKRSDLKLNLDVYCTVQWYCWYCYVHMAYLSRASNTNLFPMLTSSIKRMAACLINWPVASLGENPATEYSSIFSGILQRLWSVLPLLSSVAAIPERAVASAIKPLLLTASRMRFKVYVFPVPPEAWRPKIRPSLFSTDWITCNCKI